MNILFIPPKFGVNLILLLISLFIFDCKAQNLLQYQNVKFRVLSVEDGLPTNHAQAVNQDSLGYIWIGTYGGMIRYDGLKFKLYDKSNGFTDQDAKDFYIDIKGNIWVVSEDNLFIFDPITESFTIKRTKIKDHGFRRIIADRNKKLWIIANRALFVYDLVTNDFVIEYNADMLNKINVNPDFNFQILDKKNNVWFSHDKTAFYKFNIENNKLSVSIYDKSFKTEFKVPNRPTEVFEDKTGNLFFSNNGLFKLQQGKSNIENLEYIDLFNGASPKDDKDFFVLSIANDYDNNIWVSTENHGIFKYNQTSKQIIKKDFNSTNYLNIKSNVAILSKSVDNNLWMYYSNSVIMKLNPTNNKLDFYRHDPTNPNSPPPFLNILKNLTIFTDKSGVNWQVLPALGILKFDTKKAKFSIYKNLPLDNNSFSGNSVWGIHEDNRKNLWVGVQNSGLNILNEKSGKVDRFLISSGKEYASFKLITDIEQVSDDEFWVASVPVSRWKYDYNSGKLSLIEEFRPKDNDTIGISYWMYFDIFKDSQGKIWLGALGNGGLECYISGNKTDKGYFKHYKNDVNNPKSISNNTIWHIMEDDKNRLWISTSMGLNYLDKERKFFTRFIHDSLNSNSINSNIIKQTFQDRKKRIWISTEKGGLEEYIESENKFIHHNTSTGFPSNDIFAVYDDSAGNLWISSGQGVIRYNPETNESLIFTTHDGLQGKQFLPGVHHRGKSGKIYFGGSNGLNHFYPDSISVSEFTPRIVFTSFKVFQKEIQVSKDSSSNDNFIEKSISYCDTITLNYRQNVFSLEFAALDFTAPNTILYKYILEGINKEWIEVDANNRILTYTNLPEGSYLLKVKSTNSDGIWCNNTKSLRIIILPPWWRTWWFRIFISLFILGSIIMYFKYKTYEIKKKNKELERKVSERTLEVMQQKEELQQQAEELEATNEELIAQSDALIESNEELNLKNDKVNKQKEEIEKSFKTSQIISEFGQRVTATFDLDSINEIVYGYICSIMATDAFGIGLYNSEKNEIEYIGFIEEGNKINNFVKSLNSENSLTAWCFNNQQIVFVNDLFNEYSNFIPNLPNVSTNKQPLSIIHLPLSTKERRLGIIVVNSFKKDAYTNMDLIHLQSLASYITISLDNADAYKTVNAQKEKLLELDNFKEAMTGMIVHDLKNPLNAIIGLSSMNQDDELMQMVNTAGNQMLNLVLNILDVQKFENTEVKLNLSETPLLQITDEASKQVSLLIKQKKQKLKLLISPKIVVVTDQEIMVRVFVNMLTNAIKYTPNDGEITIKFEAAFHEQDEYISNSMIQQRAKENFNGKLPLCLISVNDTGQGIPEDKQHLVFEKFGQVEAKKSGGVRSTGLGMTFCKMVIEAHAGNIWLTSEVGMGTTFFLTLPCLHLKPSDLIMVGEETNEMIPDEKDQDDSNLIKCFICTNKEITELKIDETFPDEKWHSSNFLKIMAVDDDPFSLKVYRDFLCDSKIDFYFIEVIALIKTVDIAETILPDIILMDWEMPDISGTELIKNLKINENTKAIPVVMVTSRSGNSDIQTAFDVGAIDYIRKPIEKTEIIARVKTIAEFVKILKPLNSKSPKSFKNEQFENNSITILYVEDSYELRSYVSACLSDFYNVIESVNGKEGLEKAIQFCPDLIISDINMPEMDGWDLCNQIRENPDISHIPIILLTAQQSEESKIKGYSEGADDYLTKPFSQNLLFARIKNLIKIRQDLKKKFSNDLFSDHTVLSNNKHDLDFLEKLNKIIEENLSNANFDVFKCCELMGISRSKMYKKLQVLTGESFNIYVRIIRLKIAASLLKNSDRTITEISYMTGFSSQSYFSRCFLDQFGISPTQFTKNESQ